MFAVSTQLHAGVFERVLVFLVFFVTDGWLRDGSAGPDRENAPCRGRG